MVTIGGWLGCCGGLFARIESSERGRAKEKVNRKSIERSPMPTHARGHPICPTQTHRRSRAVILRYNIWRQQSACLPYNRSNVYHFKFIRFSGRPPGRLESCANEIAPGHLTKIHWQPRPVTVFHKKLIVDSVVGFTAIASFESWRNGEIVLVTTTVGGYGRYGHYGSRSMRSTRQCARTERVV